MNEVISNHLLIVEDKPIISAKIAKKLSTFIDSKELKFASNVKEALYLLDKFKFKVIVLDLNLTEGHGITILIKIKENNLKSLVYVFSVNTELKKICLKKGATAFFDKSKDFDKLILTIKKVYHPN